MLFRVKVAVYSENHMKHYNTFCVQNVDLNVTAGGPYSNLYI
jgi:hypothetical protein